MILLALCTLASGCAGPSLHAPPAAVAGGVSNPLLIPTTNADVIWGPLVDVVDDYFEISTEAPARLEDNVLIEGRIETRPQLSPTLLEPWRKDTVGADERLENTLQTIRRRAFVRMIPSGNGYLVHVAVFKELEEVRQPEYATSGAAVFRNDDSLRRFADPVEGQPVAAGWIPLGNDVRLEQEILARLQQRLGL